MIALPILMSVGFSEECSGQVLTIASMAPGAIAAWIGRVRAGGVDILGRRV